MRYIASISIIIISLFLFPQIGHAKPSVSADQAILMEQSSGRILFDKSADEKRPIASITKIMTAIIAIESGEMDETVKVSKRAAHTEGSSLYLKPGDKIKLKDLVYGMMLRSGNDAAVAIAEHVGGSVGGFRYLMNDKARWLGMTNSHFANPHGLDAKTHYSTAHDMAILMRYAMGNDVFKTITGTTSYKSAKQDYPWRNKNKLLTTYYDHCTGGKTGFTKVAGRTLVTTAQKGKMHLIAVTLNAPDDWEDHKGLYKWAFSKYHMTSLLTKGRKVFDVAGKSEVGVVKEKLDYPLSKREKGQITVQSTIKQNTKQNRLGETVVFFHDKPLKKVSVYRQSRPHKAKNALIDFNQNVFKHMIGLNGHG